MLFRSRWAATFALLEVNGQAYFEALGTLLNSSNVDVRNAVIYTIGEHPDGRSAGALVLRGLADAEISVARSACRAAGKLRLMEANALMMALLKKLDGEMFEVLAAISIVWLPSNYLPVLEIFRKGRDADNRKAAASVLRDHVTAENWKELFDGWKSDKTPRHRVWACELAGQFGGQQLTQELEILRHDANGHVRKAAVRACFKSGELPRICPSGRKEI